MNKKLKPKAYSMACGSYEITYKCSKCEFKFDMAGEKWKFCPSCGAGISWGVITKANEEWKQKFYSVMDDKAELEELLTILDKHNKTITDDCRYSMEQTESTKTAVTNSNIDYYLGVGWSKETLVAKGFFTQEQIDKYLKKNERLPACR